MNQKPAHPLLYSFPFTFMPHRASLDDPQRRTPCPRANTSQPKHAIAPSSQSSFKTVDTGPSCTSLHMYSFASDDQSAQYIRHGLQALASAASERRAAVDERPKLLGNNLNRNGSKSRRHRWPQQRRIAITRERSYLINLQPDCNRRLHQVAHQRNGRQEHPEVRIGAGQTRQRCTIVK
jgi:hypothetical protein